MGLLAKNKNEYEQAGLMGEYFDLPSFEVQDISYDDVKKRISNLDIDMEEKNEIITKINSLKFIDNAMKKKRIKNEIDDFLEKYKI